jgi:hypothetical protein
MIVKISEGSMSKRIMQLVIVSIVCLIAGIAVGRGRDSQGGLLRTATVNSIPRSYGRLAAVDRTVEGPVLYFEADDGTIRIVAANYGPNYGSLNFKAVTVPRN